MEARAGRGLRRIHLAWYPSRLIVAYRFSLAIRDA
jgi:hypothetical protein